MSYASLNRLGGAVVMAAGVSAILFNLALWAGILPRSVEYPGYLGLQIMFLFGLVAVFLRHAVRPGVLLVAGFALAAVDIVLGVGFSYYASFAFPILRDQFPEAVRAVLSGPVGIVGMAGMGIGILGNILFNIAVLRARLVPRWAPALVIFSQLLALAMLPYNLPVIVASVGLIGIGYAMAFGAPAFVPAFPAPAVDKAVT